jgi:hypothetical protein
MAKNNKRVFYPDQPVPPEFFVGREDEIYTLVEHGVAPALEGHPKAIFVLGDFGMGKSSIANYVKTHAEENDEVYGIYASLAGAETLPELARLISRAAEGTAVKHSGNGHHDHDASATVQEIRSAASLLTATQLAVRQDQPRPTIETATHVDLLRFLKKLRETLFTGRTRAILLVLDEIDTLAPNKLFAPFVKGLVDTNAQDSDRVPLLLLVCGVRRCWQQMIQAHQSIERVLEPVEICPMSLEEAAAFYRKAFAAAAIDITSDAIKVFHAQSGGVPRLMHLVGEKAYRADRDQVIDRHDAQLATLQAARDYGQRFVRERLFDVLHTREERSILNRIGQLKRDAPRFLIGDVAAGMTSDELSRLHHFLDDLVRLDILRPGETRDEFEFCLPLVQLYFWLVATGQQRL